MGIRKIQKLDMSMKKRLKKKPEKKISREDLIKTFENIGYKLTVSVINELIKEDGNIDSWIESMPFDLVLKYTDAEDALEKGESLLDSKILSDIEREDLMTALMYILHKKYEKVPMKIITESMRKLMIRMSVRIINEEVNKIGGAPLLIAITDKKHPWDLDKGSIKVNEEKYTFKENKNL